MDDTVTLTSSTDSKEEIERALAGPPYDAPEMDEGSEEELEATPEGVDADPPSTEDPSDSSEEERESKAGAPGEPEAADATSEEGEAEPTPKKPRRSRFQERISTLTHERDALALELERLRAAAHAPPEPEQRPVPRDRPRIADFDDEESYYQAEQEWIDERIEEKARELQNRDYERRQQSDAQSRQEQLNQQWNDRYRQASEQHEDFEEFAHINAAPVSQAMFDAMQRSEAGPRILYHLGKNPEVAEKIIRLDPVAQIHQIGRIEAEILATPNGNGNGPAAAPNPPKQNRKPVSKAPDPISPVKSGSPGRDTSVEALTNADYDSYREMRGDR